MLDIEEDFKQMDRNGDGKVDLKELQKEMGKPSGKRAARKDAVKFLHEVSKSKRERPASLLQDWPVQFKPQASPAAVSAASRRLRSNKYLRHCSWEQAGSISGVITSSHTFGRGSSMLLAKTSFQPKHIPAAVWSGR
jgi:hypothetical protein